METNTRPRTPSHAVNDAVYKLQLSLLDGGAKTLDRLYLAGTIISRADYNDVVTERSIADLCGYPLCPNSLPPQASRCHKGHYRISLKEHKVYDVSETKMYCSSKCVIDSKAFAQSLSEERCDVLDLRKVERVLKKFGDDEESEKELGVVGDLGFSKLKIEEKSIATYTGDLEGWAGPSNAIEGYVPKKDRISKKPVVGVGSKKNKLGSKGKETKPSSGEKNVIFNDMDFMSTLLACDEYSVSKLPSNVSEISVDSKMKGSGSGLTGSGTLAVSNEGGLCVLDIGDLGMSSLKIEEREESVGKKAEKSSEARLRSSLKSSGAKRLTRSVTWADETNDSTGRRNLCEVRDMEYGIEDHGAFEILPKPSTTDKASSSNNFIDAKMDITKSKNICEVRETQDSKGFPEELGSLDAQDNELLESAQACALALSQAAGAVASGESDIEDVVSKAGIIILPRPDGVDEEEFIGDGADEEEFIGDGADEEDSVEDSVDEEESTEEDDMLDPEQALKWPRRPESSQHDLFNPEDSWFDAPPEGFNLTLSPFATMWNALFTWITSSTLAYIYGKDDSCHEEFLYVNGRGYPPKTVLADGRSSEIKQTLGESLSRALPEVVAELGLPLSSVEKGMVSMLNTMSFIEALPAFRMKQWQVIALLFIDGLSVCRIPALTPRMTNRRVLIHRVLDGARITVEEYEVMKDFLIPLGRAPQFSSQSGA